MTGVVAGDEQDLVKAVLESKARGGLPVPCLPVNSLPIKEWVDFADLTEAMNQLDLDDAEVLSSGCLRDEKPQEKKSEGSMKALRLLRASKEQADQAEVESCESRKQLERERRAWTTTTT